MTDHSSIIAATVSYVKQELAGAEGGHDWWHIYRVWQLSRQIAAHETADMLIVELGALLHDIADSKLVHPDALRNRTFLILVGMKLP